MKTQSTPPPLPRRTHLTSRISTRTRSSQTCKLKATNTSKQNAVVACCRLYTPSIRSFPLKILPWAGLPPCRPQIVLCRSLILQYNPRTQRRQRLPRNGCVQRAQQSKAKHATYDACTPLTISPPSPCSPLPCRRQARSASNRPLIYNSIAVLSSTQTETANASSMPLS